MIVVSCSRQVWSIKQYVMSVSDKQWVTQIATSTANPFIYHTRLSKVRCFILKKYQLLCTTMFMFMF